jgi:hypothetical protein
MRPCGDPMPTVGTLDEDQIDCMRDWVYWLAETNR